MKKNLSDELDKLKEAHESSDASKDNLLRERDQLVSKLQADLTEAQNAAAALNENENKLRKVLQFVFFRILIRVANNNKLLMLHFSGARITVFGCRELAIRNSFVGRATYRVIR